MGYYSITKVIQLLEAHGLEVWQAYWVVDVYTNQGRKGERFIPLRSLQNINTLDEFLAGGLPYSLKRQAS